MDEFLQMRSVSDITDRWPAMAEHDIEQSAKFVEWLFSIGIDGIQDFLEVLEDSESALLSSLARAASWHLVNQGERTHEESLQIAYETIFDHDQHCVVDAIRSGDQELANNSVRELLAKWPAQLAISYSPSPLFPQGRHIRVPLDLSDGKRPNVPARTRYVVDCHGQEEEIKKDIVEYITRYREPTQQEVEEMQSLAESLLRYDETEYERLRQAYGTKAATLFVLVEAISNFRSAVGNEFDTASFEVPKFTAAPIELYRMYKNGDSKYEELLEQIRQQAIAITDDQYDPDLYRPLVAVRSSAVSSEDGDKASGAGIYASAPADPRDPESFRQAVETVFDSLDSENAQAYLQEKGIENESMGLLIQRYVEDTKDDRQTCIYGFIHSSDPFGRFIALSSELGELLFDRAVSEERFMLAPPYGRKQPTFHYNPDHDSAISDFSHGGARLANAALFAEKLLGKKVELEFAIDSNNKAYVLQVRPLPNQERPEAVKFPSDVEPIVECRAVGVGDVIVTVRDNGEYTDGERVFDLVDNESHTGNTLALRDKRAVLVIGYNEANSGHLQMLARDRNQICLYPSPLTSLPSGVLSELEADPRQTRVRRFRVIADGHRGVIIPFDERRNEALVSIANALSTYMIARSTERE